jgi:hypothetical protein
MLVCCSRARERFPFLTFTPDSFLGFAITAIRSVDSLLGPAITPGPVRALRTILSFGIVHAFFVGAADDTVSDDGGADRVVLEEGHDLLADGGIMAHTQAAIGEPALQKIRFVILGEDNADGDFGGQLVGRPIEGDRSDGVAVKTALGLLGEPGPKWLSSLPHFYGASALRSRPPSGIEIAGATRCARPVTAANRSHAAVWKIIRSGNVLSLSSQFLQRSVEAVNAEHDLHSESTEPSWNFRGPAFATQKQRASQCFSNSCQESSGRHFLEP